MKILKEYMRKTCGVTLRPMELRYLDRRVFEVTGYTTKEYIDEYKDVDGRCDIEIVFFDDLLSDIRREGIDSLRNELVNYLYEVTLDLEELK